MSIKIMSQVWEHSKQRQGSLLVLLAIADFADDNGVAYPSIRTLAHKARLGERETQYVIRKLESAGELIIHANAGPSGVNVFQVVTRGANFAGGGANFAGGVQKVISTGGGANFAGGVQKTTGGGAVDCTQTVIEPSGDPGGSVPSEFSDENSSETLPPGTRADKKITAEFRDAAKKMFPWIDPESVDEQIDAALAHKGAKRWTNQQYWVRRWLHREFDSPPPRRAANSNNGSETNHLEEYRRVHGRLPWEQNTEVQQ